jgi:hypothetical protein
MSTMDKPPLSPIKLIPCAPEADYIQRTITHVTLLDLTVSSVVTLSGHPSTMGSRQAYTIRTCYRRNTAFSAYYNSHHAYKYNSVSITVATSLAKIFT